MARFPSTPQVMRSVVVSPHPHQDNLEGLLMHVPTRGLGSWTMMLVNSPTSVERYFIDPPVVGQNNQADAGAGYFGAERSHGGGRNSKSAPVNSRF